LNRGNTNHGKVHGYRLHQEKVTKQMMILRTGVDLVEIARFQQAVERHGQRFLERVFTPKELAEVGSQEGRIASLAARFAAKEAVSKAFGTGIGQIYWREIEILRGPEREPILHLHGNSLRLAEEQNLTTWSLSLSHTEQYAIAMVVALGG
jgi:holo-[acyl-carrier protein] synthase